MRKKEFKTINRNFNGNKYICVNPYFCISPQNTKVKEILVDSDEYVIADINYKGEKKSRLAIRWYISGNEYINNANKQNLCMGYPNTRGYPTWFLFPESLKPEMKCLCERLKKEETLRKKIK